MNPHNTCQTAARVAPPLTRIAGRLTLVGTGLGALALIAVSAQMLWHPSAPASSGQVGAHQPPQVWLSSLSTPSVSRFAAPDYAVEPLLPRDRTAPLPPVATRGAVDAPRAVTPPTASEPQIAVIEGTPPVIPSRQSVTPGIAAIPVDSAEGSADPGALAALRAPTRSPLPRQRPLALAPVPEPEAPVALAELAPNGMVRSRMPQRRPETVTRLASLDLSAPAEARPREPAPSLAIPALNAAVAGTDRCASSLTRAIPRRSGSAGAGSAVIGRLNGAGGDTRDRAIVAEVLAGNVPDFLRTLVPVSFTGTGANGQQTRITICVTPDYLAVGSDRDFVRVPLGLPAAMQVAERFDMVLPTTRMVDAIYQQASVRLSPSPMDPGAQMASTGYFLRHNATVEGQRSRAGGRLGQLVSGHKKDLVLTNRLNANPGRVAIYGWHRQGGAPIQPLSTVHGASYADYSHGIRLVSRRAFVNGREVDLRDLLADSRLVALVSSEGTITNRQMLASLR